MLLLFGFEEGILIRDVIKKLALDEGCSTGGFGPYMARQVIFSVHFTMN